MERSTRYAQVFGALVASSAAIFLIFVLAYKPLVDWAFRLNQEERDLFLVALASPIAVALLAIIWLCEKEKPLLTLPVSLSIWVYCIYIAIVAF